LEINEPYARKSGANIFSSGLESTFTAKSRGSYPLFMSKGLPCKKDPRDCVAIKHGRVCMLISDARNS